MTAKRYSPMKMVGLDEKFKLILNSLRGSRRKGKSVLSRRPIYGLKKGRFWQSFVESAAHSVVCRGSVYEVHMISSRICRVLLEASLKVLPCILLGGVVTFIGIFLSLLTGEGVLHGGAYGVVVMVVASGVMCAIEVSDMSLKRSLPVFSWERVFFSAVAALWGGGWISLVGGVKYFLYGVFSFSDVIIFSSAFSICCFVLAMLPRRKGCL